MDICVYVSVWQMGVSACKDQKKALDIPGAGNTGDWKPHVGARNWSWSSGRAACTFDILRTQHLKWLFLLWTSTPLCLVQRRVESCGCHSDTRAPSLKHQRQDEDRAVTARRTKRKDKFYDSLTVSWNEGEFREIHLCKDHLLSGCLKLIGVNREPKSQDGVHQSAVTCVLSSTQVVGWAIV